MKRQVIVALLTAMMVAVGCSKEFVEQSGAKDGQLMATIEPFDDTRAIISDETLSGGSFAYWWEPGDEIGVFTNAGENNVKYVSTTTENTKTVYFAPVTTVSGTPTYAYYPYSAEAGEDMTAVQASMASEQTIVVAGNNIPGIARYGYYKQTVDGADQFGFKHVLATVRFNLDATDTKLAGLRVKSVSMKVMRNFIFPVAITGDYTFNAETGVYTQSRSTSNALTINFEGYPTLENTLTYVTSMFPSIKKNDRIYFTVTGVGYTATFYVISAVTMAQNGAYTFNLPFTSCKLLRVKANNEVYVEPETPEEDPEDPGAGSGTEGEGGEGNEGGEGTEGTEPETPVTPETPTTTTGSFTCATYNVKSSTSGTIGSYITADGWDFFGLSEDFSNITSNLSSYTFGTRTRSATSLWGSAPKDGLGFATKTATCSFLSEYVDEFDEEYGGLLDGANTSVDKGFRVYPVQLADGVVVDVIITHMNTYSSDGTGHIDCQHAQLKEVATYIANHKNGRPVIFMGDTNCRYTRHDFETYFWSIIRGAGLNYADPWVDQEWKGVYPTYPSKSLMVSDATGTNSETDIICSTTQNGEVVDKVIYINDPDATVQLKADSFLRDMDYNGLSDHMPIVVKFTWTKTN